MGGLQRANLGGFYWFCKGHSPNGRTLSHKKESNEATTGLVRTQAFKVTRPKVSRLSLNRCRIEGNKKFFRWVRAFLSSQNSDIKLN